MTSREAPPSLIGHLCDYALKAALDILLDPWQCDSCTYHLAATSCWPSFGPLQHFIVLLMLL